MSHWGSVKQLKDMAQTVEGYGSNSWTWLKQLKDTAQTVEGYDSNI